MAGGGALRESGAAALAIGAERGASAARAPFGGGLAPLAVRSSAEPWCRSRRDGERPSEVDGVAAASTLRGGWARCAGGGGAGGGAAAMEVGADDSPPALGPRAAMGAGGGTGWATIARAAGDAAGEGPGSAAARWGATATATGFGGSSFITTATISPASATDATTARAIDEPLLRDTRIVADMGRAT